MKNEYKKGKKIRKGPKFRKRKKRERYIDKNPLLEQPTGKQTMAPGFFSPSKTDCFSPFHLTLKAFLFFSSFIFCLQSSPTISIYNNNNNREDAANSRISQLFTPLISLYSNTTVVETSLVIGVKYIALFSVLCFLWFLAISLKVWNFGRYPDSFLVF